MATTFPSSSSSPTSSSSSSSNDKLESQEAASIVKELRLFAIDSFGSPEWRIQNAALEKLSINASLNVKQGVEEVVSDYLIEFQKIPILVEQLVINDTWRTHAFPLVRDFLGKYSAPFTYSLLQQSGTILNLLQSTLFKREALESAGDSILDLIDVIMCGMARLLSSRYECNAIINARNSDDVKKTVNAKVTETQWRASWAAVACLCHMTHHMRTLSVSAVVRIVEHHELINLLVMLLLARPWERDAANLVAKATKEITIFEGQIWLTLGNLLLNYRYKLTDDRKMYMLRLLEVIERNTHLYSQFEFLEHMHRAILHAKLASASNQSEATYIGLAQSATPPNIVCLPCFEAPRCDDWKLLARNLTKMWVDTNADTHTAVLLAAAYNLDSLESLLPDVAKCSKCGKPASFKCSACKNEWYCQRKCQVQAWPTHKALCRMMSSSSSPSLTK